MCVTQLQMRRSGPLPINIMQYKFIYTRYKYKYLDSTDYSDLNFLLLEFSVQIFHDWSLFFPGISYIGAANIF